MVPKNVSSGLLWLLPILIIIILLSSSFRMWREAQDLTYDLLRSESTNAAEQIKTRLELFLFERRKDLSHLASLNQIYPDSLFIKRFLTDASGIISREKSYYAISYLNAKGELVARTSPDTFKDSSVPLFKLKLNDYLNKLSTDTGLVLASLPITSKYGEQLLVLFKPVFSNSKLEGAVTATLRVKYIIQNILTDKILKTNYVIISIDDTVLYKNDSVQKSSEVNFSEKAKSTAVIQALERTWSVSVYPPGNGLFDKLIRQNNVRFIINGVAAVIASWLLALALYISHRLRLTSSELARSEERYRHLAENASDMIFQQSVPDGDYDYVSPAAERLTGYNPQEYYKTPFLFEKILIPEDKIRYRDLWQQTVKGETPFASEFSIIHKNGDKRWLNQRNSLVRDKNGVLVAVEGILTDITDQKKAIFEREKLIKELESKNRDLERFTYIISHELKTPLITIKGFLGYLEDEAVKGDFSGLHQDVLQIIGATETMSRLLNDLINLNQIGYTKIKKNVDLQELLEKCLDSFSDQIRSKSINVTVNNDLPVIKGYANELMELFQNLIDNAIKFSSGQPSPVIEIGSQKSQDGVILYIRDNGVGFEAKYSERIFGLFNKLNSATQGTGAGLALAKRIVEHHGGWIRAESPGLGKGTTIYFMLPFE